MRMEGLALGFAVEGRAGPEQPAACPAQVMAAAAADQEMAAEASRNASMPLELRAEGAAARVAA